MAAEPLPQTGLCSMLSIDFRFFFAMIVAGRGNGKRLAAPLPLGSPEPPAV
jgi:hypothetical protein